MQDESCWANHPDAVMVDGELRLRHKGKLETVSEREERLEKNSYMRFSRSLDSISVQVEVFGSF